MEHLPNYYTTLFNAVTDALHQLSQNQPDAAMAILIQGQQQAEDQYLGRAEID